MNNNNQIETFAQSSDNMPILFVGHGNPMNAISDNSFRKEWIRIGKSLGRPKAILCISAHWLSRDTYISTTEAPKTIYDFGGFPEKLSEQIYPAPGATQFAEMIIKEIPEYSIHRDNIRGLDHGAWSVLMNMFPEADIPTFQMSLDYHKSPEDHYNFAKKLAFLRSKGVLVIGSGNIVHNLRLVDFSNHNEPFTWATEFDEFVAKSIVNNDIDSIINYSDLGTLATLAHPTNEHLLPLLYVLALRKSKDNLIFFNSSIDLGSMSMRSLILY